MKATVNLDDRLYRRVKIRAAEDGVTVTSIFERALQRYLDGLAPGADVPTERPSFELPLLAGEGGLMPGVDLTNSADLQRLADLDNPLQRQR